MYRVAQLFANNTQPSRPKPRAAAPRPVARGQPHTIESQHNAHLLVRGNVAGDAPRTHIQRSTAGNTQPFRYMFEKIDERSEVLNDRIDFIADGIEEAHGLEDRLQNPTRAHQSEIHAVGRICCDATEGRLNETSLLLETSRDVGMGKCVKLNVRQLDDYSLFPGQVKRSTRVYLQGNATQLATADHWFRRHQQYRSRICRTKNPIRKKERCVARMAVL